ncbi:trypsin-like peptidase domain-containing protein [Leptothermofonsia sichuanensis E412]|uniref:S1C family serine protease n=1 Tax=Leptothermofonsia sichuanensis TaxID=2917832 RepID=UPI001CA779FC|nr:trypsin-like peptidase domain-containing protein [Leptothermofonsia sichuanensis]QZZ19999.1 trypsin-like peptidase domain-containing protein [Leptothermofonsia sichuanensis E412]
MKLLPWLFAGSFFLVARTIASAIPSNADIPLLTEGLKRIGVEWQDEFAQQPEASVKQTKPNQTSGQTGKDCKEAGPSVVTIHAGQAFGSGSIVSPDGLVITNHHVVRPARSGVIGVKLINGKQYQGRVIAADPVNDLALVKLNTQERLPAIRFGNPSAIQLGQPVCAIGSPFARPGVLTRGQLTTVRRNGDLQSALVLQPGNSGGPLLNQQGEMIGVNKAIWQSPSGENSGISFATNVAVARNFIAQRGTGGNYYSSRPNYPQPESFQPSYGDSYPVPSYPMEPPMPMERFPMMPPEAYPVPTEPFQPGMHSPGRMPSGSRLGLVIDKMTLEVQSVERGSPAQTVGIRVGDRLVAVDGIQIEGFGQLQEFLSQRPSSMVITVNRADKVQNLRVNF